MAPKFKEEFENQAPFINSTILRPSGSNFGKFKIRTWTGKRKWMRRPDVGVWFLSFTFLLIGCHGYQEQRFAMEPQDQVNIYIITLLFWERVIAFILNTLKIVSLFNLIIKFYNRVFNNNIINSLFSHNRDQQSLKNVSIYRLNNYVSTYILAGTFI